MIVMSINKKDKNMDIKNFIVHLRSAYPEHNIDGLIDAEGKSTYDMFSELMDELKDDIESLEKAIKHTPLRIIDVPPLGNRSILNAKILSFALELLKEQKIIDTMDNIYRGHTNIMRTIFKIDCFIQNNKILIAEAKQKTIAIIQKINFDNWESMKNFLDAILEYWTI